MVRWMIQIYECLVSTNNVLCGCCFQMIPENVTYWSYLIRSTKNWKTKNQLRVDQSSKIKCNFHMWLYFMFSIFRIKNVLCGYSIQIITQTLWSHILKISWIDNIIIVLIHIHIQRKMYPKFNMYVTCEQA